MAEAGADFIEINNYPDTVVITRGCHGRGRGFESRRPRQSYFSSRGTLALGFAK
jgi:hypothetical protein